MGRLQLSLGCVVAWSFAGCEQVVGAESLGKTELVDTRRMVEDREPWRQQRVPTISDEGAIGDFLRARALRSSRRSMCRARSGPLVV